MCRSQSGSVSQWSEGALWPRCDSCCYTTDLSASQDPCDILFITRSALSFCDCIGTRGALTTACCTSDSPPEGHRSQRTTLCPIINYKKIKIIKSWTFWLFPSSWDTWGLWSSCSRGCWWPNKHRKGASRVTFVMENSTTYGTNDVPQLRKMLKMDSSLWTLHTSHCLPWPDWDVFFSS